MLCRSGLVGFQGDQELALAALESYKAVFPRELEARMRAKLGLRAGLDDDADFIGATFGFLQQHRPDFTTFFRTLSRLNATVDPEKRANSDAPLRDLFVDRAACDAWLDSWRARLAQGLTRRLVQVEGDVVVPIEQASGKHEYAARTIRPRKIGRASCRERV